METAQVIWGPLQVAFYSQGDESIQTWVQILILSLVSFEIFLCLSFLAWKMKVIIPHGALSTEPDHVENSKCGHVVNAWGRQGCRRCRKEEHSRGGRDSSPGFITPLNTSVH